MEPNNMAYPHGFFHIEDPTFLCNQLPNHSRDPQVGAAIQESTKQDRIRNGRPVRLTARDLTRQGYNHPEDGDHRVFHQAYNEALAIHSGIIPSPSFFCDYWEYMIHHRITHYHALTFGNSFERMVTLYCHKAFEYKLPYQNSAGDMTTLPELWPTECTWKAEPGRSIAYPGI